MRRDRIREAWRPGLQLHAISRPPSSSFRCAPLPHTQAANSAGLISQTDIDGFLVGGASLKPEFLDIIRNAATKYKTAA
jgi:hypothetical protein